MGKFFTASIIFFVTINKLAFGTDTDCEAWLKQYEKSFDLKLVDKIECTRNPGKTVIGTVIVYLYSSKNSFYSWFYFTIRLKL